MPPLEPDELDFTPNDESELVALPSFEGGGRVERTGIALVHEGEFIMPAPGSEALLSPEGAGATAGQVINYYFPVEVEVTGDLTDEQLQRIAQFVFDELETALRSQI